MRLAIEKFPIFIYFLINPTIKPRIKPILTGPTVRIPRVISKFLITGMRSLNPS